MGCCSGNGAQACATKVAKQYVVLAASGAKVACVVAILSIVSGHLRSTTVSVAAEDLGTLNVQVQCLLGHDFHSPSLCNYAYAVCGFSLAATLLLCALLFSPCNLWAIGAILEFIVAGASTSWWVVAAIILSSESDRADDLDVPRANWRHAVLALSWVIAVLFATAALTCLVDAVDAVTSWMCGSCIDGTHPSGRQKAKLLTPADSFEIAMQPSRPTMPRGEPGSSVACSAPAASPQAVAAHPSAVDAAGSVTSPPYDGVRGETYAYALVHGTMAGGQGRRASGADQLLVGVTRRAAELRSRSIPGAPCAEEV